MHIGRARQSNPVGPLNPNHQPSSAMPSLSILSFLPLAFATLLLAAPASAQLKLSGKLTGAFTNPLGPNDSMHNAADGSAAWFRSGIPYGEGSVQSAIEFSQKDFVDVEGGLVASEIFRVTNGRNLLNSTATSADFNLYITLTSPEAHAGLLTAIPFSIENTPNEGSLVDDVFNVSWSPIAPFLYAGYRVQFEFVAPETLIIAENESAEIGELYVSFTPVPEPATYAAFGASLLLGLAGLRAWRRRDG